MNIRTDKTKRLVTFAAQNDATVLITGPTGVGKSRLAQEIHDRSQRASQPFVCVNLASLHEGTLESELFGHERGAFTGADQRRPGRFELAQGGTLFLDEIAELTPQFQARLLDFIQNKKIIPVGSNREIHLNVRVLAATHRELKVEIAKGRFREDLFHRLRVMEIPVIPLCERVEELDEIVHKCIHELCIVYERSILRISPSVAEMFEIYTWPGNIRELRNVLESAILTCENGVLEEFNLPEWFIEAQAQNKVDLDQKISFGAVSMPLTTDYRRTMYRFEKEYFRNLLVSSRGSLGELAEKIDLSRATLYRRLRELGLSGAPQAPRATH